MVNKILALPLNSSLTVSLDSLLRSAEQTTIYIAKSKQAFVEEGLVDMIYLISIYLGTCAVTRGEAKIKILATSVNPSERISI